MKLIPDVLSRPAGRLGAAAQNALEVARFGGLETGEEPAPYDVVAHEPVYRLRRYFTEVATGPPVLLVPPLMLTADVYDVSPSASGVGILREQGADPWVVDFGSPEREEGGLERDLADHVLAVSDAVERVRAATGRDVHLGGYSQGGMFCYQTAAYRRNDGIASLVTFGSPVDLRGAMPLGLPEDVAVRGAGFIVDNVLAGRAVPGWATRTGFRLLDPAKSVQQRLEFLLQLHDREGLLPRERQRRFLMGEGWVAWPGPALAEFMRQFLIHNRMLQGGFTIGDELVTLADIDRPILCFVGEVDEIAPPGSVRPIRHAAPRPKIYEVALPAGHFGLVVGSKATSTTWPVVAAWAKWCDGEGELPDTVKPLAEEDERSAARKAPTRASYGAQLIAGAGGGVARGLLKTANSSLRAGFDLAREAAVLLPRLARIGRVEADTRLSLALLLDEQAKRAPDDILFLYEDRAHSYSAAKHRIDSVVRGLLSVGVRAGEHVGVLMGTRPSALAVVAALNRIGAVVVLLRPGPDVAREAELGQVTRIIADPEHAAVAGEVRPVHSFLLGAANEPRSDTGLTDLEQIDPDQVEPPAWYEPNPGRASDLAFILFSGDGEHTDVNRITNGRWALSAFGTASAAALTDNDTVYSVNPLFHPSGLLTGVGGALAGRARLSMASSLDPETFWDEARRYGVTVVSYTWAQLRELADAPPHPGERHHPVRLFMGSGMPAGLWRRVVKRFGPANVLEFWASTEGEAILANVSATKPGSLGRPLPGSAEVRLVRWNFDTDNLVEGPDGFAVQCADEEMGMLLARVGPGTPTSASPLRNVFERGDAWLSTDSLFVRDADGDHWLQGSRDTLIRTQRGIVAPLPISRALEQLPAVDLAISYGVPDPDEDAELAVAAMTLRPGRTLTPADVTKALAVLEPAGLPDIVHVVDEIPLTAWYRPLAGPLRAAGLPSGSDGRPAWRRDPSSGSYEPLALAA